MSDTVPCPHCGEDIASDASFCRHCGATDESGWNDDEWDDPVSREEEDDEYQEFLQREFPDEFPTPVTTRRIFVTVIVALLCLAFLIAILF